MFPCREDIYMAMCSSYRHIHGDHFEIQDGGHKSEMLECQHIMFRLHPADI